MSHDAVINYLVIFVSQRTLDFHREKIAEY